MGGDRDRVAGPAGPSGAAPVSAVAAALGATLLVALLATWAASIGPGDVFSGDGLPRRSSGEEPASAPTESPREVQQGDRDDTTQGERSPWAAVAAALVQFAAVAMALYLCFRVSRWGRRLRRVRRPRLAAAPDLPFEVLEEPQRVVKAIVSDAAGQREVLLEGVPRNGIVACWHRFETQAATVGLAREPWETSSEFTLRLLDLISAEPWAVGELAALYREARFSDHELGEESRARAVAALDALHHELGGRLRTAAGGVS